MGKWVANNLQRDYKVCVAAAVRAGWDRAIRTMNKYPLNDATVTKIVDAYLKKPDDARTLVENEIRRVNPEGFQLIKESALADFQQGFELVLEKSRIVQDNSTMIR